ncbi:MAG: hypothetical protein ACXVAY_11920 [Mucilaginibacter sp.]
MENQFDHVMSKRTDIELIKILNSPEGDYVPEAIEAAQREYNKRNLSTEQITVVEQELEQNQQANEVKANEKLSSNLKIFAFLFPGLLFIMFAGTYKADGYDRKAKELILSTFYGWGFYIGIIILITILSYF